MTTKEALYLLKTQLQPTPQNNEAFAILEDALKTYTFAEAMEELGILDDGTVCRNYDEEEE